MEEERTKCTNQLNDFSKSKQVNDCYLALLMLGPIYYSMHVSESINFLSQPRQS